uniref:Uncharacterized protein n=1 Tax=Arundo donax TaxID=35708 RepID=A0A0A9GXJ2_ARUDO
MMSSRVMSRVPAMAARAG